MFEYDFTQKIPVAIYNGELEIDLSRVLTGFLRTVSAKEKFKHLIKKPLDAIKSLVVSFNPNDTTFSLSVQDRELYVSNNLTQSLTDVFTTIGETALKTETPICFFIDEIQYMKQEQLRSLIAALHRTNQLGYPVMIFVFAMVKCGELPCTISNVAHNLGKEVYSISTTRAQLISKGIIYPVRYKELDFTVPEFSGYIQRLDEYKKWNNQ